MKKYGLPRSHRLQHRADFDRVYRLRQRAGDEHLLIYAAENDRDHSRIGLSVSRKHGHAVRRTRLKRLLREAFRLTRDELPTGLDLILIPCIDSGAELEHYRRSLRRLVPKLARRVKTPERR